MFVNFILARHLFNILRNVAQGAARDAIHAAAGSRWSCAKAMSPRCRTSCLRGPAPSLEADESEVTGLRDLDAAAGPPHEWRMSGG